MSNRIVVITCDGPEHRYVTNRICAEVDVEAILVTEPVPNRSWRTVLKKSLAKFVDKALLRSYLKLIGDSRQASRDLHRIFGESCEGFQAASKVIEVGRPKAGRLRREVER